MFPFATIQRTAILDWSDEDECFTMESPLAPRIVGTGYTQEEARAAFEEILSGTYSQLKSQGVSEQSKSGRPIKNGVNIHAQVKQQTKNLMADMAEKLGLSQGEVLDCAVFALNKQVSKKSPKLLVVSPPRQLIDVHSYSRAIAPNTEFTFKTNDRACASQFDGRLRWDTDEPCHYRWFDEQGVPVDFIAKLKKTQTISEEPFLFEVTLDIQYVPEFIQKTAPEDIDWAQRELQHIRRERKYENMMGESNNSASVFCTCDSTLGGVENWGCNECSECKKAYPAIATAIRQLKFGGKNQVKFAKQYDSFQLVWEAISANNWQIWIKTNNHVVTLLNAPCELMLAAIPCLRDFCNAAH